MRILTGYIGRNVVGIVAVCMYDALEIAVYA